VNKSKMLPKVRGPLVSQKRKVSDEYFRNIRSLRSASELW
jgi:hypothetical protein